MKAAKRTAIIAGLAIVVLGVAYFLFLQKPTETPAPIAVVEPPLLEYGIPIDSFDVEDGVVKQGQVLSQLFASLGASDKCISALSLLTKEDFNPRTVRTGNTYKAFYTPDSTHTLCYLVYIESPMRYAVFELKDTFKLSYGEKPLLVKRKFSEATINTSLWNAVADSGINRMLALDLSDTYAWSIDFFGLQKGDGFAAIYDESYVDDSVSMGLGRIHAARFNHANKAFYAFYFEQDSIGSYWDEQGNSLKKAFLKAPLKFSRVSSHFSYARKHPVLRIVRPHTGVDYAAPSGTPVMSIGDGTVIEKGYKGGGGHTVKIRHNSMYTTAYLHLSGYGTGVAIGSHVSQGQVIGYVGSTGLSTGPHLDFRVWKGGTPVNPLTIESPPVEPIREENRPAYDSLVRVWTDKLDNHKDPIKIPDSPYLHFIKQ